MGDRPDPSRNLPQALEDKCSCSAREQYPNGKQHQPSSGKETPRLPPSNAGLSVGGGGLASSHGLTRSGGTIESLSSGTSTFAGGLNISGGGINFALPSCAGSKGLTTDAGGGVVCSTITAAPAGSDSQVQYNNGGSMGGAAQLVYDDTNTYVGIGTSTPWGEFSVDQLSSKGRTKPIFVVADNGTSSPFIFVSQKGVVSFGS